MFGAGFAKKVVEEINKARSDPAAYSKKINDLLKYFHGKVLELPKEAGIETTEGQAGYKEAADFLAKAAKVEPLKVDDKLTKVAEEIVAEMRKKKDEAEVDKVDRKAIIKKHGHTEGRFGDSTDFGSMTPQMVVVNLLVDDGNKSRSNRKLLFNKEYKILGVGNTAHDEFGSITFIAFASDFVEGEANVYA